MPKLELSVMAELGTPILSLHGAASNWGAENPQSPSTDTQGSVQSQAGRAGGLLGLSDDNQALSTDLAEGGSHLTENLRPTASV